VKTVLIVADSSFFVETIRLSLRSAVDLEVVGKLDGRVSVRHQVRLRQPQIVLVDEMEAAGHALARIRECREEAPGATIVALTMRMDETWIAQALAAGARACVSKSAHLPSLDTILLEIVNGHVVVVPPAAPPNIRTLTGRGQLSEREREIVTLVADGLTNARIGKQLSVTEQTVKFHLSNIYRKLGVTNRTEASRYVHLQVPGLAKRIAPRLVPEAADAAGSN
jgi:DNA-binding NarL/FixJ family response regulator